MAFIGYLDVPDDELPWLEATVALHHKNLFRLIGAGQPFFVGSTFEQAGSAAASLVRGVRSEDAELLHSLVGHAGEVFEECGLRDLRLYPAVCRGGDMLKRIREALDRIGMLERRFHANCDDWGNVVGSLPWDARRAGVLTRGFLLNADHLASFEPHPLRVGLERVSDVVGALKRRVAKLNSHQRKAAQQTGSAILIAPTGTGKTEAGLLWAAKQNEADGLRGRTFVLLPYQASMNAMQRRLIDAFSPGIRDTPEKWESEVAMIHGRSTRAAYERLLEFDYSPTEASRLARLQSDLAHLNVAPIRICSPFQIVRLLFTPKGVEGLIVALSGARLIFDEIHAYDLEVTALALAAMQLLAEQFGSRALFMTATMPSHLREVIDTVLGPLPLLRSDDDVIGRPARHRVRIVPHDALSAESIAEITKAARQGSVLVVVNQVSRAIQLYRALRPIVADIHLLHSRFTHSDRFKKEKEIAPRPGRVLIATQAVEVSLDVDFDLCFSELAPVESLLQRFGRCNRQGRQAHPAGVTVYGKLPEGQASWLPYGRDHLEMTAQVLADCVAFQEGLLLDSTSQPMLDSSYPESLKQSLRDQMTAKIEQLKRLFVEPFAPFGMDDDQHLTQLYKQWEQLFDGEEVLPESFYEQAHQEESWLARTRYLVPISGRKYVALRKAGRVKWDESLMCSVVAAPYTDEGLDA